MANHPVPGSPPAELIVGFTRHAARRLLLRRLLVASIWGAGASGGYGLVFLAAQLLFGLRLQLFEVGVALFAVLAVRALRRARLLNAAGEVDRRLGLHDRLTSFLEFSRRPFLDPEVREAQAAETAAAVAAIDVRRALRIPALLFAGPLALLLLFAATSLDPWLSRVGVRAPGGPPTSALLPQKGGSGGGAAGEPGAPAALRGAAAPAGPPGNTAEKREPPSPAAPPRSDPAAAPANVADVPEPTNRPAPGPEHAAAGGPLEEPVRLFSETVTKELTPVAAAPPRRGPAAPPPAPAPPSWVGRVAFKLAPQTRRGGGGGAPGEGGGKGRLDVVVDFTRVPPAYRDYVRRYFEGLQL